MLIIFCAKILSKFSPNILSISSLGKFLFLQICVVTALIILSGFYFIIVFAISSKSIAV
jgi:hypothetical protein